MLSVREISRGILYPKEGRYGKRMREQIKEDTLTLIALVSSWRPYNSNESDRCNLGLVCDDNLNISGYLSPLTCDAEFQPVWWSCVTNA